MRRLAMVVASLLAAGLLAACDPVPPRLVLTVTTSLGGGDDDPGDGTCASGAAGGACTLQAALEEGNHAVHGADVVVGNGATYSGVDVTVFGDVRVNPGSTARFALKESTLTVADGGRLALSRVNTSTNQGDLAGLALAVDGGGTASVHRAVLDRVTTAGGSTFLASTSIVFDTSAPALVNGGTVVAVSSSLFANELSPPPGPVLSTFGSGQTNLRTTAVARPEVLAAGSVSGAGGGGTCTGTAPVSAGHLFVEQPCGGAPQPTDGSGAALAVAEVSLRFTGTTYLVTGIEHRLEATSPLVDAIPLGDPACDPAAVDIYGNPRGVDGDGDGVAGCDIGAVERQP